MRKWLLSRGKRVNRVLLFGQSRHYHRVAKDVANTLGVSLVVLVEGYFRPGFITMELDGVNGYSRTLKRYVWQPGSPYSEGMKPEITRWHFQKIVWHSNWHYLAL